MEGYVIAIIIVVCISVSIGIGVGIYLMINAKPAVQDLDATCNTGTTNKYSVWLANHPDKWDADDKTRVIAVLVKYGYGTPAVVGAYKNESLAASLKGCLAPVT